MLRRNAFRFLPTCASLITAAFACTSVDAQGLSPGKNCSFDGPTVASLKLSTAFSSAGEAIKIVGQIAATAQLVPRFIVTGANVANAQASIIDDKRYILFNQDWISTFVAKDYFSGVALIAHEMAHHLNNHVCEFKGSSPDIELEADTFAGCAVAHLGGTLDNAQKLFKSFSEEGSATHPGRAARLSAVEAGFKNCRDSRKSLPALTASDFVGDYPDVLLSRPGCSPRQRPGARFFMAGSELTAENECLNRTVTRIVGENVIAFDSWPVSAYVVRDIKGRVVSMFEVTRNGNSWHRAR